jgi:hypothetical protein
VVEVVMVEKVLVEAGDWPIQVVVEVEMPKEAKALVQLKHQNPMVLRTHRKTFDLDLWDVRIEDRKVLLQVFSLCSFRELTERYCIIYRYVHHTAA